MARRTFRVPLPHAGMNADAALSGLDANEAPFLNNLITWEPGHVRPRRGFTIAKSIPAGVYGTFLTDLPISSMSIGDRLSVSYASRTALLSLLHPAHRRALSDTLSLGAGSTDYRVTWTRGTAAVREATAPSARNTYGPSVNYDGSVYGISLDTDPTDPRYANWASSAMSTNSVTGFAGQTPGRSTRLMRWGGAVLADTVATITLNNGATSGTFAAGPASSMVGMLIYDSASYTGRDPAFGFSYTYRITSHVAGATAFSIDRPFGMGATAAQVPNLAGVACTLVSRAQIPLAPCDIGHVALHKERIFVSQPFSSVVVSGVPMGRSVNAIAWSLPGEPNKWNSTNIAAADDRSDEAVTGIVSVAGRLLIFKPTRTYELVGDSEDNFEIRLVSSSVGCVDPMSIAPYEGGAFVASERGIMFFDGVRFVDVTQSRPGHGVRTAYLEGLNWDGTTAATQRRVTCVVTRDHVLLVSFYHNRAVGWASALASHHENMCYHIPTRSWGMWSAPTNAATPGPQDGNGTPSTGYVPHFTTYADQSDRVYGINGYGVLFTIDEAWSPLQTTRYAAAANGYYPGTLSSTTSPSDVAPLSDTSNSTSHDVYGTWITPLFEPYDVDEFKIADVSVEYLAYMNGAVDLATDSLITAPGNQVVEVTLRPDYLLTGNRAGILSTDTGATFALPVYRVRGRNGGTTLTDQRKFVWHFDAKSDANGAAALPMPARGVQLSVALRGSAPGHGFNPGTRVYGIRLGVDGPTITPGFDK